VPAGIVDDLELIEIRVQQRRGPAGLRLQLRERRTGAPRTRGD
jgi:hypothetical protein